MPSRPCSGTRSRSLAVLAIAGALAAVGGSAYAGGELRSAVVGSPERTLQREPRTHEQKVDLILEKVTTIFEKVHSISYELGTLRQHVAVVHNNISNVLTPKADALLYEAKQLRRRLMLTCREVYTMHDKINHSVLESPLHVNHDGCVYAGWNAGFVKSFMDLPFGGP